MLGWLWPGAKGFHLELGGLLSNWSQPLYSVSLCLVLGGIQEGREMKSLGSRRARLWERTPGSVFILGWCKMMSQNWGAAGMLQREVRWVAIRKHGERSMSSIVCWDPWTCLWPFHPAPPQSFTGSEVICVFTHLECLQPQDQREDRARVTSRKSCFMYNRYKHPESDFYGL